MLPEISNIKGIHPGAILKRELKNRNLKSIDLAVSVNEHKQTISAIINERRGINPSLSIKLGQHFNVSTDYFLHLQASFEIEKELNLMHSERQTPDLTVIRKILFWDTDFEKIDWHKQKSAIIKRIFERGNDAEIQEIISFYGRKVLKQILEQTQSSFQPSLKENFEKYFGE